MIQLYAVHQQQLATLRWWSRGGRGPRGAKREEPATGERKKELRDGWATTTTTATIESDESVYEENRLLHGGENARGAPIKGRNKICYTGLRENRGPGRFENISTSAAVC